MKGKFIKVRCLGCKNEQVIYKNVASVVTCVICGKELAHPQGGEAKIVEAQVIETYE